MEQKLSAGLGEGQIVKFTPRHEVETAEVVGKAALLAGACFALELVDQIDHIEETAP